MAKLGNFVGQKEVKLLKKEEKMLTDLVSKVCQSKTIGKIRVEPDGMKGIRVYFDLPEARSYRCFDSKDTVNNLSTFRFWFFKQNGYLERTEPRVKCNSYTLYCGTNAKYHQYRRHAKSDFIFEGKNHYIYNDSIPEMEIDIRNWLDNVMAGRVR